MERRKKNSESGENTKDFQGDGGDNEGGDQGVDDI